MVCPNGIVPTSNLCQLYSGYDANYIMKCDQTSSSYDHCAEDWKNCLAEPYWDFCRTFPELCLNSTHLRNDEHHDDHRYNDTYGIKDKYDMFKRICSADHDKYCPEGDHSPPAIWDVCDQWGGPLFRDTYSTEVGFTSLWTLCRADIGRICSPNTELGNSICPNGRVISENICAALPEGSCTAGSSNFKPCASDIYSCMAMDREYDFCLDFPSLCETAVAFPSLDDLTSAVCN